MQMEETPAMEDESRERAASHTWTGKSRFLKWKTCLPQEQWVWKGMKYKDELFCVYLLQLLTEQPTKLPASSLRIFFFLEGR